jgi:hypothetical protein
VARPQRVEIKSFFYHMWGIFSTPNPPKEPSPNSLSVGSCGLHHFSVSSYRAGLYSSLYSCSRRAPLLVACSVGAARSSESFSGAVSNRFPRLSRVHTGMISIQALESRGPIVYGRVPRPSHYKSTHSHKCDSAEGTPVTTRHVTVTSTGTAY